MSLAVRIPTITRGCTRGIYDEYGPITHQPIIQFKDEEVSASRVRHEEWLVWLGRMRGGEAWTRFLQIASTTP